jgi:hypothetical protein
MKACQTKTGENCTTVIANSKTHEIAKAAERWTTAFRPSGNGMEVRRAETTMEKARRLASGVSTPKRVQDKAPRKPKSPAPRR